MPLGMNAQRLVALQAHFIGIGREFEGFLIPAGLSEWGSWQDAQVAPSSRKRRDRSKASPMKVVARNRPSA